MTPMERARENIEALQVDNFCPQCGTHWLTHNDDGSCIDDAAIEAENREADYAPYFFNKGKNPTAYNDTWKDRETVAGITYYHPRISTLERWMFTELQDCYQMTVWVEDGVIHTEAF